MTGSTAEQGGLADPLSSTPRTALRARLEARREEIEGAALARVYAIADPVEVADPEYSDGLKLAVSAALDYGLRAVESGKEHAPPLPTTLLAQARLAARLGVRLDTVLRRYFAGYTLFGHFLLQEGEGSLGGAGLKQLMNTQAVLFDRLVVAVVEEYEREGRDRPGSSEQRRLKLVRRLLDGELQDSSGLAYETEGWHVGVVASGPEAAALMRGLAETLDRSLLLVRPGEETVWAWLGGRRPVRSADIAEHVGAGPQRPPLAVGEPGEGVTGWRLTHRQARAAWPIAARGVQQPVLYAEVPLLAAILHDDLLATSLRKIFLAPLAEDRDGGETLRETLRAYFEAERNVSSAAAALGLNRHTVTKRLRTIEELLGRPVGACFSELETALRLEELEGPVLPHGAMART